MDDNKVCTECGAPVAYGDRHHNCGSVAMKYQKEIELLRAEVAALKAPVDMEPELWLGHDDFGNSIISPIENYDCVMPFYSAAQLAQVKRERDFAIHKSKCLEMERASQEKMIDSYKKDAERYRRLRDVSTNTWGSFQKQWRMSASECDDTIDKHYAAMQKEKE